MKIFNLHADNWDETRDHDGWRIKEAFVGHHIGGELIGASMAEVEPGSKLWPYHTHHANEEWLIVLEGEPTLRTPEGERVLTAGDVACFPRGKDGAHQVINRTESTIRVLMLSSMVEYDTLEYLDTGKVLAKNVRGETIMFARPGPTVAYWEDEEPAVRDEAAEAWAPVHPLYEAGRYDEAADRGREVLEAFPHPRIFYNVACCESLAGRTADAIEHLRQAIDMWEGSRDMAKGDSDFDAIRDEPAFQELIGR